MELQSGEMRLVFGRSQRHAQAHVHDTHERVPPDKPVTIEPIKAFPLVKDLITDVSWNFEVKKEDQAIQAAPTGRAGRNLADAAGGHRSGAGISEMHRVLPLPGRLSRSARSSDARSVYRPALPHLRRRAGDASTRHGGPHDRVARSARNRLLQYHEVLHQGLSGEHRDNGQRDNSAKGDEWWMSIMIR